jgi:hypothetical protein
MGWWPQEWRLCFTQTFGFPCATWGNGGRVSGSFCEVRVWFIFYKEGFQGPHMYIEFVAVQNPTGKKWRVASLWLSRWTSYIYMLD